MRALYAVFLALAPWLALAQVPEAPPPDPPVARWGPGWLWLVILFVLFIALVAWGLGRGRFRGGPPVAR